MITEPPLISDMVRIRKVSVNSFMVQNRIEEDIIIRDQMFQIYNIGILLFNIVKSLLFTIFLQQNRQTMLSALRKVLKFKTTYEPKTSNFWSSCKHMAATFSTNKDKNEDKSTIINISETQLDRIKAFVKQHNFNLNTTNNQSSNIEEESSSSFFQNQQTKLSLKIMQIETIEQLTPLIRQYQKKEITQADGQENIQNQERLMSIIRCKFIILHTFTNLNGKINHKDIKQIYKDVCHNINKLEEIYVYKFYRIVANQIKVHGIDNIDLPLFPIISKPSHNNSQLLSLLIMIYPDAHPNSFQHYSLNAKITNQEDGSQDQTESQMLYDPVHLIHIIKHISEYKDHYQQFFKQSMSIINFQETSYTLQETIKNKQLLCQRQFQAALFCLHNNLYSYFNRYYLNNIDHLNQLTIKSKIQLLKQLLMHKKQMEQKLSKQELQICRLWVQRVLGDIVGKQNKINMNQEEQIEQNLNFKNVIEIFTIIYLQHKEYLDNFVLQKAVIGIFTQYSRQWQPSLVTFNTQQLLNILVCYKAYYDYYQKDKILTWIPAQNKLIQTIFECYKQQFQLHIKTLNEKQVFFWCYFGDEFKMIDKLLNKKVYEVLISYRNKQVNNDKIKSMIDKILINFNEFG